MSHKRRHPHQSSSSNLASQPSDEPRDEVMEASMDSFPASDPPGWIRTRAAASDDTTQDGEPVKVVDLSEIPDTAFQTTSSTAGPALRRAKRIAMGVGIGAVVLGGAFFVSRVLGKRS